MSHDDQSLGEPVPDWTGATRPEADVLEGQYARLELLSETHASALFDANAEDDRIWDYLAYGPFDSRRAYLHWVREVSGREDPRFYAIRDLDRDRFGGVATLMRIAPSDGSIEVGNINFSVRLQKTRAATEAIVLLARHAFSLGYRRFEWKCNALNLGSRRAAERFGFSYEGVFRQATVAKGRNRDTAWYAMIDKEYPALDRAWTEWLDPGNFDASGRQKKDLASMTRPILVRHDPMLSGG